MDQKTRQRGVNPGRTDAILNKAIEPTSHPRRSARTRSIRMAAAPMTAGAEPVGDAINDSTADAQQRFLQDVLEGLRATPKALPCKYFYDRRGSRLFDRICRQPEYYPTRTELAIMERYLPEIVDALGRRCLLIEYGSGSSLKTRLLLERIREPAGYVPIDISADHLSAAAVELRRTFPQIPILPVAADYTQAYSLPEPPVAPRRRVVYFPGSTIGNFDPPAAVRFLSSTRQRMGPGSGLLIGVDLKKDPAVLHAAYNDAAGVTAAFNLNLLRRINRELGGTFSVDRFAHYAYYNPRAGRIEMHLVSLEQQFAEVAGERFTFSEGESLFTESSYKYTPQEFSELAASAGYHREKLWTDPDQRFSVQWFGAE